MNREIMFFILNLHSPNLDFKMFLKSCIYLKWQGRMSAGADDLYLFVALKATNNNMLTYSEKSQCD